MNNEALGNYFLFGSEFVIGEILPSNKNLLTVSTLHNYLSYKKEDPFMKRYMPERTTCLIFLDIIDIDILQGWLNCILSQYKAKYPYAQKEDFIEHHLSYSMHILKEIVENQKAIRSFNIPFIESYSFYFRYDKDFKEYIDYILSDDKDLNYHLQYCNRIIDIIDNLDFDAKTSFLVPSVTKDDGIIDKNQLKSIWLPEARYTIDDILETGIEKGIWNRKFEILTKRGSMYGTGKTLLGSLAIALKGNCISQNTDYKIVGEAFCSFFRIKINKQTNNPYKAFSNNNPKIISELKRAFKIK